MANNSFRLRYEAKKHIRRLGSFSAHKRAGALARLRELGPDGITALHDAIDQEKAQWQHRQVSLSCMLLILLGPALLVFWAALQSDQEPAQRGGLAGVGLLLASLIVAGVMSLRKPASAYHSQIIALAALADMSSIGRLIEALDTGDAPARNRAEAAVASLLPSITADNVWNIGSQQSTILYRHLDGDSVPLIVAILSALPILRDDYALPMLERLANSEKPAARHLEVRQGLLAVLPLIRDIAERKTGKHTLLRASAGIDCIADTALRPVEYDPVLKPDELLRANVSQTELN